MPLCEVCVRCLEGIHDPALTPRLGLRTSAPDEPTTHGPLEFEKYVYGHHLTEESWWKSRSQDCTICDRIGFSKNRIYIKGEDYRGINTDYYTIFEMDMDIEEDMLQMRLRWEEGVWMEPLALVDNISDKDELYMELDSTTDGPRTRELVLRWVEECTSHHRQCHVNETANFVPTRLLEINNNTANTTFRLVLRSECQENIRYIALSHVWGHGPVEEKLRLLGSTYDELRQGKPIDYLPKTFHDTMTVAQRLGVKYVWIDSLCILQDSKEDWQTEASTMQDVYRYAYITISALSGENEHAGLFYERDPKLFTATMVNMRLSKCGGEALRYYHAHDEGWDRVSIFKHRNILMYRAWCFQEILLSPCVLHFGALQVFWECYEKTTGEYDPGNPPVSFPSHKVLWKPIIDRFSPVSYPEAAWDTMLEEWYDTVAI
ncbi:heterokaryon incompatibility protein [Pyrenophora tritici-repentis]|nr:heterokaryon incompatibility protein [Pyrenophora tritici-repentis]KAI1532816.1 heterokaryon incompatibility protein [Pyrenophora tritici-repentis]KAI1542704.1 heterokaryon incompatibility protein [Pyrenophora tritici-repentis]KAI1561676.1 heterokaryon incompatibility protein [Pyrenophora tritici-repentis]KAI1578736.1 heterokaryon incompatibility protein [Pyrenophora tritici-repentis]